MRHADEGSDLSEPMGQNRQTAGTHRYPHRWHEQRRLGPCGCGPAVARGSSLDYQGDATVSHGRPWRNAEEATQAAPPIVEQPGPVAQLVPIARPHRRLVGIEIVTGM